MKLLWTGKSENNCVLFLVIQNVQDIQKAGVNGVGLEGCLQLTLHQSMLVCLSIYKSRFQAKILRSKRIVGFIVDPNNSLPHTSPTLRLSFLSLLFSTWLADMLTHPAAWRKQKAWQIIMYAKHSPGRLSHTRHG